MRNDKNGFTLIELLAVIIILAIIALITTPIILNVLESTRKDAAKDKAWGAIEAVKLAYTQNQVSANPVNIPDSGLKITFAEDGTANVGGTAVTVSGEKPSGGSVTIKTNGTITCDGLQFTSGGSYSCTTEDGNTMTCEAN